MKETLPGSVAEHLYWAYANLAMAHAAITSSQDAYSRISYSIRSRLFKGLTTGSMNIQSLFEDERWRFQHPQLCAYCGQNAALSLDHLLSRKRGGTDNPSNLVYACRSCNSSKGEKDLIEWMLSTSSFPSIAILRRYLKNAVEFCEKNGLLDLPISGISREILPYSVDLVPDKFPAPSKINLYAGQKKSSE